MRLVLDTVIVVRGLIGPFSRWGDLLFERANDYEWIVSPAIVSEYTETLYRPLITKKYRFFATRNLDIVRIRITRATMVEPSDVRTICRDPEDDKFLAAAKFSNADFIVSEDNDLLSLGEYEGIVICTAESLLLVLNRERG